MAAKLHICNSARATDANVRLALIERFGGAVALRRPKKAKYRRGHMVEPAVPGGPLCGIVTHLWAALAVAVTHADYATESIMQIGAAKGVLAGV